MVIGRSCADVFGGWLCDDLEGLRVSYYIVSESIAAAWLGAV